MKMIPYKSLFLAVGKKTIVIIPKQPIYQNPNSVVAQQLKVVDRLYFLTKLEKLSKSVGFLTKGYLQNGELFSCFRRTVSLSWKYGRPLDFCLKDPPKLVNLFFANFFKARGTVYVSPSVGSVSYTW